MHVNLGDAAPANNDCQYISMHKNSDSLYIFQNSDSAEAKEKQIQIIYIYVYVYLTTSCQEKNYLCKNKYWTTHMHSIPTSPRARADVVCYHWLRPKVNT